MYRADESAEMRSVGEAELVQSRAAAAIVGHADLKLGDRVEPVVVALQTACVMRSYEWSAPSAILHLQLATSLVS